MGLFDSVSVPSFDDLKSRVGLNGSPPGGVVSLGQAGPPPPPPAGYGGRRLRRNRIMRG